MNLEHDLRRALRPQPPPAGFAGRVLNRIERERHPGSVLHRWRRAAAASVLLATLLGGYSVQQIRERRRGERARDEVLRAFQIAGEKVRYAQQEVRAIGSQTSTP